MLKTIEVIAQTQIIFIIMVYIGKSSLVTITTMEIKKYVLRDTLSVYMYISTKKLKLLVY